MRFGRNLFPKKWRNSFPERRNSFPKRRNSFPERRNSFPKWLKLIPAGFGSSGLDWILHKKKPVMSPLLWVCPSAFPNISGFGIRGFDVKKPVVNRISLFYCNRLSQIIVCCTYVFVAFSKAVCTFQLL